MQPESEDPDQNLARTRRQTGIGRIPDRHHRTQLIHSTERGRTYDLVDAAGEAGV